MSSDSSDYGRCYSEAYLFYGLLVHSESLVRPIEAFNTLHRQLAVLQIITTRRRSGYGGFDSTSAASRIPEEIWQEIRSSLISQELDHLEEIERVGKAESCGAGVRLKKKAEKEWECDKRKDLPGYTAGVCEKCRRHTLRRFEMRENALIVSSSPGQPFGFEYTLFVEGVDLLALCYRFWKSYLPRTACI